MIKLLLNLFGKQTFKIINLETGNVEIEGEFIPEDITERVLPRWIEEAGMGREAGYLQYIGGSADELSLRVRFFSDCTESIKHKVDKIKKLAKIDPEIGQPPRCRLEIGEYSFEGVFTSVGDILYSVSQFGQVFDATINLTMRQWVDFPSIEVKEFPPKLKIFGKSPKYVVKENETWEHIGKRAYGEPLKGTTLQYLNPEIELAAGMAIEVPVEVTNPAPFHEVWSG